MSYGQHFYSNMKVATKCLWMAFMHALHAIIPCAITSHEYWESKGEDEDHCHLFDEGQADYSADCNGNGHYLCYRCKHHEIEEEIEND